MTNHLWITLPITAMGGDSMMDSYTGFTNGVNGVIISPIVPIRP